MEAEHNAVSLGKKTKTEKVFLKELDLGMSFLPF